MNCINCGKEVSGSEKFCKYCGTPVQAAGVPSQPPVNQAPMGQPPMGQAPMGQPPMGQPPMGQAPIGQPPMGQPPMGQPPIGQPPIGQPPMGQAPIGQPPMGQAPMRQMPAGQPPMGQAPMYPSQVGYNSAPTMTQIPPQQAPQKKKGGAGKVIGISLIVLLVLAIAGGGVFAFFNFVAKTPKAKYFDAENKYLLAQIDSINKGYSEYYGKELKPYKEGTYDVSTKIKADAKLGNAESAGMDENTTKVIDSILKKSSIEVVTKGDGSKKQSLTDVSLIFNGNPLINLNMIQDDKKYAIKAPEFYDKYFYVDGNDLEAVYDNLDVENRENLPKKMISNNEVLDAIKVTDKEVKDIVAGYGKLLYEKIDEKQIELKDGVEFTDGEYKEKCQQFTIKLTEEQIKTLFKAIAEKEIKDTVLQNLVATNISNVIKVYSEAGYYDESDFDVEFWSDAEKIKKAMQDKDEMTEAIEDISLPDGFKMTVLVNGKGDIVQRIVEMKTSVDGDEADIRCDIKGWTNEMSDNLFVNMEIKPAKGAEGVEKVTFAFEKRSTKQDKEGKTVNGILNLGVQTESKEEKPSKATVKIKTVKTVTSETESKLEGDYALEVKSPQTQESNMKITGKFSMDEKGSVKNNERQRNYKIGVVVQNTDDNSKPVDMTLTLEEKAKFGGSFAPGKISSDDRVDLAKVTQDELQKIQEDIVAAYSEFAQKNEDVMSSLVGGGE